MSRPAFVKLGGAVLTDKTKERALRRAVSRRIIGEIAKAGVPVVLFHGVGSYGHPPAQAMAAGRIGPKEIADVLAGVGLLHAEVISMANKARLRPLSIPLHALARSEGGVLVEVPVGRIEQALDEGYTPVLSGTIVRDDAKGWRIVSADELMAALAADFEPRLAVFATAVEGVLDDAGEIVAEVADVGAVGNVAPESGAADVTGAMYGKVRQGLVVAQSAPTWIINGMVRGRLLDALRGKPVPGTRLVAP